MSDELEVNLLTITLVGAGIGLWSILLARGSQPPEFVAWGRRLFLVVLLTLGGASLVAAFHRAGGVVPLGLCAGLLVSGMLWEGPQVQRATARSRLPETEQPAG